MRLPGIFRAYTLSSTERPTSAYALVDAGAISGQRNGSGGRRPVENELPGRPDLTYSPGDHGTFQAAGTCRGATSSAMVHSMTAKTSALCQMTS